MRTHTPPRRDKIISSVAASPLRVVDRVRNYPLLAVVAVGTIDLILHRGVTFWVIQGAFDGVAHLLTAALLLALFARQGPPLFIATAVGASVLIDLDHIPLYVGWHALIAHAPRPYTHSLTTVVVAGVLACLLRPPLRRVCAGIAVGVLFHFVRDIATAGLPLFWPVSTMSIQVPYELYAAAILGTTVALLWSQRVDPLWDPEGLLWRIVHRSRRMRTTPSRPNEL